MQTDLGIKVYEKAVLKRFFINIPLIAKLSSLPDVDFQVLVWHDQQLICFTINGRTFDTSELSSKFVMTYLVQLSNAREEELDAFLADSSASVAAGQE